MKDKNFYKLLDFCGFVIFKVHMKSCFADGCHVLYEIIKSMLQPRLDVSLLFVFRAVGLGAPFSAGKFR
jgi:hypothetical protein